MFDYYSRIKTLLFFTLFAMTLLSCASDPEPISNIPSVSLGENGKGYRDEGKGEAGELMRTSVRLYGISTVPAGAKITERGFLVGEDVASLNNGSATRYRVAEETDNFSRDIPDLKIDHTYYFSAYVTDGNKTERSVEGAFHTKSEGYALVTGLTRSGDKVKAEIRDNGGSSVKSVGFCWSTNESPDVISDPLNVWYATLDKDNSFTASLPYLESGKYYIRAFADNGNPGRRISYSDDLTISIEKEKSTIVLSTNEIVLDSKASSFDLEINHNVNFTVDLGDCTWIHEEKTKALQTSTVSFSVDENTGVDGRAATIIVRSEDSGLREEVTVTQMQKDALVIAKDSYTVGQEGGSISIKVGHNIDFTVDIEGDWISRQTQTKAYVDEELKFDIAENPTNDNREGRIIFISSDKKITQEVKIYQAQTNVLVVSEKEKVFDSDGGNFYIEVTHNVSITVDLGGCTWIHKEKTKALQTSTVSFGVDKNTSVDGRVATIIVRSEVPGLSEEVTVTQMRKDAIVIAKDLYTVGQKGGSISLKRGRNVGFTKDINCDWIHPQAETDVNDDIVFIIDENTKAEQREGIISFKSDDGRVEQPIKVVQEPNIFPVDIPDPAFKAYCVEYFDTNRDGEISNVEALSVDSVNIVDKNISSLEGIEYFIHLTKLNCSNNNLSTLDISGLTSLTELNCSNNNLSTLDISGLTSLTELDCSSNNLNTLKIGNNNTSLTTLNCSDNNLSTLGLNGSGISSLTELRCEKNKLSTLNVGRLTNLRILTCSNNNLVNLNVIKLEHLTELRCEENDLNGSLDVSNSTSLNILWCRGNPKLTQIWLKQGHIIQDFKYDPNVTVSTRKP